MFENKTHRLRTAAVLALGAFALSAISPYGEERLKSSDHKKLGSAMADYVEAVKDRKGIDEARDDFTEILDKAAGKAKVAAPLSLIDDIGQAFYLANEYDKKLGRKGAIKVIEDITINARQLEYALWLPKRYDPDDGPWPLIILVGEPGEAPKEHIEEYWIDPELRKGAILVACAMPEDEALWPVLGESFEGGVANIMRGMGEFVKRLGVDVDRVFLAGRGQAGIDACMTTAAIYPLRFAGVIGRAGDMGETAPDNFRNLSTFFAGGGANVTSFEEAAVALGHERVTVAADATEADIWTWVQEQRREGSPTHVEFAPAHFRGTKAYWIELHRFDYENGARVEAVADRETNTITITGEKVETLYVYLNDQLVDMDKPVKVICNGRVDHEALVPRNLSFMLENHIATMDFGRVYTSKQFFELPAAKGAEE